jgi:hypothetical protein
MNIATFLAYFSLALFLFVMYLRYQYVKNTLLAAQRKREIAFLQQMSRQFKRDPLMPPPVTPLSVTIIRGEIHYTEAANEEMDK